MLFTVKEDLGLIKDLKVNVNQLMFIKMLVRDYSREEREWQRESYAISLEFQHLCPLSAEELLDLVARDIIINLNDKSGKIFYSDFEINPKYQKKFMLQVTGMPSEIFDAYPYELETTSFKFFAKNASADEIAKDYLKAIGKRREEHEEVLADIEWAVKNKALQIGLKQFIATKYWLYIRQLRLKVTPKNISDVSLG
jgi:hypothetical protein